jgi:hypothetical protein
MIHKKKGELQQQQQGLLSLDVGFGDFLLRRWSMESRVEIGVWQTYTKRRMFPKKAKEHG